MSYIGVQNVNRVTPSFVKEDFVGTGATADFTLTNEVPGGEEQNIMVVLNNVIQEPVVAYTIVDDSSNLPKILRFSANPAAADSIYVIHRGIGSYNTKPPAGSITATELDSSLKTLVTDTFTGDGSDTTFTMSEIPHDINSILVFVDGILQKSSTNFSISGQVLTFTDAPDSSAEIEVRHMGIRSVQRRSTDYVCDTFTGNGSATTQTLSNATSANNAFVFYNGVVLQPATDYAISGSTITFTFTPLNASNIMVRYQI